MAVSITGGRKVSCKRDVWRVPKRVLARALVAAFEGGRFKAARGLRYAGEFKSELQAFERRVNGRGYDAYNGIGAHDDLVIAAALVCWRADCR